MCLTAPARVLAVEPDFAIVEAGSPAIEMTEEHDIVAQAPAPGGARSPSPTSSTTT